MIDALATPGGQLLGLYFLVLVASVLSLFGHATGNTLLNLIIGAILRDMQDGRINPQFPNQSAPNQTGRKAET